jgi:hypothetical protein
VHPTPMPVSLTIAPASEWQVAFGDEFGR